jgi:hypothetical protein
MGQASRRLPLVEWAERKSELGHEESSHSPHSARASSGFTDGLEPWSPMRLEPIHPADHSQRRPPSSEVRGVRLNEFSHFVDPACEVRPVENEGAEELTEVGTLHVLLREQIRRRGQLTTIRFDGRHSKCMSHVLHHLHSEEARIALSTDLSGLANR